MPDRMQKYKASRPAQLQEEQRERAVLSAKEHAKTVVVVRHKQPSPGTETPPVVRERSDARPRWSLSLCVVGKERDELCRAGSYASRD